jgi:hypothetical protein
MFSNKGFPLKFRLEVVVGGQPGVIGFAGFRLLLLHSVSSSSFSLHLLRFSNSFPGYNLSTLYASQFH